MASVDIGSPMLDARSRKTLALLLQKVASVGQNKTADVLGIDETTYSRWQSGHSERIALWLTSLGFKVVPLDAQCVSPARAAEIQAEHDLLRAMAVKHLANKVPLDFTDLDNE